MLEIRPQLRKRIVCVRCTYYAPPVPLPSYSLRYKVNDFDKQSTTFLSQCPQHALASSPQPSLAARALFLHRPTMLKLKQPLRQPPSSVPNGSFALLTPRPSHSGIVPIRPAGALTPRPLQPLRSTLPAGTPSGEPARKLARTVYDFPDWKRHRSPNRLVERLLSIPQSNIMQNILFSVTWFTAVATLVTVYMYAYDQHDLPSWLPSIVPNAACSAFVNTTSVALSLLLVFRTNNGYGRWNEARCMWGLLVNRSRDFMRQACTMLPINDVDSRAALGRWMVAFTRCLRIHLQPEVTWQDELQNILRPEELDMLVRSSHKPVKCLHMMSQVIQSSTMNPILQSTLSQNITAFQDVLGGCERILRAPIPVSYTRHTARFLFVWLSALPLALWASCGVWTIPVVAGVTAVLCGIEEIGIQTEEPFGILPLEALCTRIQTDVLSTVADTNECLQMAPPKGEAAPAFAQVDSLAGYAGSDHNGNGYSGNGNGHIANGYVSSPFQQLPNLARRER